MKRQVRRGVFETNSSSVHSIIMCSDDEYKRWENGELYIERYDGNFVSREELVKQLKEKKNYKSEDLCYPNVNWEDEDEVNDLLYEEEYMTYQQYWDDVEYETFDDSYTTKSGEKIHAFGYYGENN